MFSKYFRENYFTFFASHNEEAVYELGPADHLSTSYFSFPCLSHPWMSDCLCVLLFPSFLVAAWLLLSLTSLWGVSLWWCSFDQGTLGLERCPAVLTALQRRVGPGSEVVTYSPSIRKLVPLLEWNPGTPVPITEFFLQQHLTPPQRFFPPLQLLFPLDSFFCNPFSGISLWVSGCYLSLVLLLSAYLFFRFFSRCSFFLLRGSWWKYSPWNLFSPVCNPWGRLSVLGTLVVSSMPDAPQTLSKLLKWSSSQVSKAPYLTSPTSSSQVPEMCCGRMALSMVLSGAIEG